MSVPVRCGACQKPLQLRPELVGKPVKCPMCGKVAVAQPAGAARPQPVRTASPAAPGARPSAPAAARPPAPAAVARPAPPAAAGGKPLRFGVKLRKDPEKKLRGSFRAELTPQGVALKRLFRSQPDAIVAPGQPAQYLRGNRLTFTHEGRTIEAAVVQWNLFQNRLAKDLADYLAGRVRGLNATAYAVPRSLLLPALSLLGVVVLTCLAPLPVLIAALFGLGVLAVVRKENWSPGLRLGVGWGLAGVGYVAALSVFVAAVAFLFLSGGKGSGALPWQEYTSAPGRYTVQFPGKPVETTEKDASDGTITYQTQMTLDAQDLVFRVQYTDIAGGEQLPADEIYKNLRGGAAAADIPNSKVVREQKVSAGAVEGWEFTIDMPNEVSVQRRIFFQRGRLYILSFFVSKSRQNAPEGKKFLDSFKIN